MVGAGAGVRRADPVTEIIAEKVPISQQRIESGAGNPVPKLLSVIARMCVGANNTADLDVLRSGGVRTLFDGVYAPPTLGTLSREFTFGRARQLEFISSPWPGAASYWTDRPASMCGCIRGSRTTRR